MNKLFPKNVHSVERIFRFLLGAFIFSLVFWGPKSLWGLLGLMPMITSLSGSCPLYTILGVSTCKVDSKSASSKGVSQGDLAN